jgi:hypothetical protein
MVAAPADSNSNAVICNECMVCGEIGAPIVRAAVKYNNVAAPFRLVHNIVIEPAPEFWIRPVDHRGLAKTAPGEKAERCACECAGLPLPQAR